MVGNLYSRFKSNGALKALGPGLITGAADDDPSGIATYSQAGAQFGFNMLWTIVLTYPFMVGIQMVSARIGCVTGKGLAANIRKVHSPWLLYSIVLLLLVDNIINIAADIAAMGEDVEVAPARPGVVDDNERAGFMRGLGDRRHVLHFHRLRVRAFAIDDARRGTNEGRDGSAQQRVIIFDDDAPVLEQRVAEGAHRRIDAVYHQEMIAGF